MKYSIYSVMFGFFIMGFVDIIGIATSYVKNDFSELTDSRVNLISFFCFLWFLILSVPTGLLMNKIGRKKTVLLSFLITTLAMCFPLINYSFISIIIAFALIGIGNTILQASKVAISLGFRPIFPFQLSNLFSEIPMQKD